MEQQVKKQIHKQNEEQEKDAKSCSPKTSYLKWMDTYNNKRMKIEEEEMKLKKESGKALSGLMDRASIFSILMGGIITMQAARQNPEYWVLLLLRCIMLAGTIIIVFMAFTDLSSTDKELFKLEERRKKWSLESKIVIERINKGLKEHGQEYHLTTLPSKAEESHLVLQVEQPFYWDFHLFQELVQESSTIERVAWYHWLSLSLISLFAITISILLLIDTVLYAKKSASELEIVGVLLLTFYKLLF